MGGRKTGQKRSANPLETSNQREAKQPRLDQPLKYFGTPPKPARSKYSYTPMMEQLANSFKKLWKVPPSPLIPTDISPRPDYNPFETNLQKWPSIALLQQVQIIAQMIGDRDHVYTHALLRRAVDLRVHSIGERGEKWPQEAAKILGSQDAAVLIRELHFEKNGKVKTLDRATIVAKYGRFGAEQPGADTQRPDEGHKVPVSGFPTPADNPKHTVETSKMPREDSPDIQTLMGRYDGHAPLITPSENPSVIGERGESVVTLEDGSIGEEDIAMSDVATNPHVEVTTGPLFQRSGLPPAPIEYVSIADSVSESPYQPAVPNSVPSGKEDTTIPYATTIHDMGNVLDEMKMAYICFQRQRKWKTAIAATIAEVAHVDVGMKAVKALSKQGISFVGVGSSDPMETESSGGQSPHARDSAQDMGTGLAEGLHVELSRHDSLTRSLTPIAEIPAPEKAPEPVATKSKSRRSKKQAQHSTRTLRSHNSAAENYIEEPEDSNGTNRYPTTQLSVPLPSDGQSHKGKKVNVVPMQTLELPQETDLPNPKPIANGRNHIARHDRKQGEPDPSGHDILVSEGIEPSEDQTFAQATTRNAGAKRKRNGTGLPLDNASTAKRVTLSKSADESFEQAFAGPSIHGGAARFSNPVGSPEPTPEIPETPQDISILNPNLQSFSMSTDEDPDRAPQGGSLPRVYQAPAIEDPLVNEEMKKADKDSLKYHLLYTENEREWLSKERDVLLVKVDELEADAAQRLRKSSSKAVKELKKAEATIEKLRSENYDLKKRRDTREDFFLAVASEMQARMIRFTTEGDHDEDAKRLAASVLKFSQVDSDEKQLKSNHDRAGEQMARAEDQATEAREALEAELQKLDPMLQRTLKSLYEAVGKTRLVENFAERNERDALDRIARHKVLRDRAETCKMLEKKANGGLNLDAILKDMLVPGHRFSPLKPHTTSPANLSVTDAPAKETKSMATRGRDFKRGGRGRGRGRGKK